MSAVGVERVGASAAAVPRSAGGWIWGRGSDLLLGCGLAYILVMPAMLWLGSRLELQAWPALLVTAIVLFVSGPHYGATLLRAYEDRADRTKYALFTVWATLGLVALTVAALHSLWLGSLLIALYASWSPWHFSGQNYGIALIFMRRRNVEIPRLAKGLFHASFALSALLAILPIHMLKPNGSYELQLTGSTGTYSMLRLGIPSEVAYPILIGAAIGYVACLVAVTVMLKSRASWRDLAPAALLVATQALWFTIPGFLRGSSYKATTLVLMTMWISAAHAVQYLWITSYYARRERSGVRLAPYLVKATLAGSILTFVPALILASPLLGTIPYDAGLAALIVSVANLHHFVLDGAIWKLRDGRVARVLLRSASEAAPAVRDRSRSWLRPALLATGALGLGVNLFDAGQRWLVSAADLDGARAAVERLTWIRRESPQAHLTLGHRLAQQGDQAGALSEFQRALELVPSAEAWLSIGVLHRQNQRLPEALSAFEAALGMSPDHRRALLGAGSVGLALAAQAESPEEAAGLRARAIDRLERLLSLAPANRAAARQLARAYANPGSAQ